MKIEMYFASIDDNICQPLEYHLHDAKIEGLSEIELIEAIPDNNNTSFVWCSYDGEVTEYEICKKTTCGNYFNKSGRGTCIHRGNLYTYGETVKFKVK